MPRKGHRTMVGLETVKEFNQRLFREGRTDAFKAEAEALQALEGIGYAEARDRLSEKYGAPGLAKPRGLQGEVRLLGSRTG